MGITAEASQGAIFKSLLLQSVNCRVFLRSLYFLKIYIYLHDFQFFDQFLLIQSQRARMMKVTPIHLR